MSVFPAALTLAIAVSQGNHTAGDYKRLIDEYLLAGSAGVPQVLAEWPADPLVAAVTEMVTPHPSRQAPFYPVASLEALVRWLEAAALAHLEAGRVVIQAKRPRVAVRQVDTGRMLIERLRSVIEANHVKRSQMLGRELQALDAGDAFAAHWLMAGGALLHGTADWLEAQEDFMFAVDAYPRHAGLRLGLGIVYEAGASSPALAIVAATGPARGGRQSAEDSS